LVENETDLKINCLRSDRGGEFISKEFEEIYELHGIKRLFSTTITPQRNGVVKRKNQTIQDMTRTMLNEDNLLDKFSREAINTTVYILNRGKLESTTTKHLMNYGRVD
jgi:transposase InsO family protein